MILVLYIGMRGGIDTIFSLMCSKTDPLHLLQLSVKTAIEK